MKIKRITNFVIACIVAFCFIFVPATSVFAETAQNAVCSGVSTGDSASNCTATSGKSVSGIFASVIDVFSAIIGVVAVIMMIYGGFQMTIGGDDPSKIKTGRTIITYALVGLIVVAFAQFFVQFVLHRVGGLG